MKDADTKAPMAQTTPIQWLTVDEGHEGQRLDNYLLAMLRGVPKTRIYRMIRKGEVRVDGRRVKAEQRVAAGERIRVPPLASVPQTALRPGPARGGPKLDDRHIRILFEDEHLLVVDKSEGLAVHGGGGISAGAGAISVAALPHAGWRASSACRCSGAAFGNALSASAGAGLRRHAGTAAPWGAAGMRVAYRTHPPDPGASGAWGASHPGG